MINIISKSVASGYTSGPQKVATNLIKGLDLLNYPYCINRALDTTSQLWIHDDVEALREVSKKKIKAVVGPNLYILPRNIPVDINFSNLIYIQPSKWSAGVWRSFGFNKCPFVYWPVGIDTYEFSERQKPTNGIVLIYFKQRYDSELEHIKKILNELEIKHEIIIYGSYKQSDYIEKLRNTKYLIWLGRQESQGIALEEALSMNVPILVWDVLNIGHWVPTNKEEKIYTPAELLYSDTTSAYYFDDRCGIKTKNMKEIENSIHKMEENWSSFEPRKYIIENLSLEKQTLEFINFFEKYQGISYKTGLDEKIKNNKKWRTARLHYKIYFYLKNIAKKVILIKRTILKK
jgi:hypothetical protein